MRPTIRQPRLLTVILPAILLAGLVSGAAADTKIGVVDSQRIFAEYDKAREAENVFQEEMRAWAAELEAMETEMMSLQEQIRSQSLLLSKERLDAMQLELDGKRRDYEARRKEILDPQNGLAVARNEELVRPINEQVSTVVERLGTEGDYSIILDIATVNAFYVDEAIDITDEILAGLADQSN
jgi:outer membrane protein